MTPDLIARIGSALFGSQFKGQLGAALGVERQVIHHWLKGTYKPHRMRAEALRSIIAARIEELRQLRREL